MKRISPNPYIFPCDHKILEANKQCFPKKSLFSTMLVPLDLNDEKSSIWRNLVPSSTLFCRPIRIHYAKETTELLQKERDHVENEIKALNESLISFVYHELPVQLRVNLI